MATIKTQKKDLYNIVLEILKTSPWHEMTEDQIVVFDHPQLEEVLFLYVLGHGGEFFAVNTILGDTGYYIYSGFKSEEKITTASGETVSSDFLNSFMMQKGFNISFMNRNDMPDIQLKEMRSLGLNTNRLGLFPEIEKAEPGKRYLKIPHEDILPLTEILKEFLKIYQKFAADPDEMDEKYYLRGNFPLVKGEFLDDDSVNWTYGSYPIPDVSKKIELFSANTADIANKLLKMKIERGNWDLLILIKFFPAPVKEPKDKYAYFPVMGTVHTMSGMVEKQFLAKFEKREKELVRFLKELVLEKGSFPRTIISGSEMATGFLKDFANVLEIPIIDEPELEVFTDFTETMDKLNREKDDWDYGNDN